MIPLHVPDFSGIEEDKVLGALRSGWVSTAGPQVNEFEKKLSEITGAGCVVAFNSGTAALQVALMVSGVQPGEIVLVPDLAYMATLNAVHHSGAIPVLMEVNAETGQIDADYLQRFFDSETLQNDDTSFHAETGKIIKAVVPLWAWGNSCEIESIKKIADRYFVQVIEDAAAAVGTRSGKKHAGTFGKSGIISFNGNKIVTTGGGGALLTEDASLAKRARHISVQAKIPGVEYIHDQYGFNNRMTSLAAALGLGQLERLPVFLENKKQIVSEYRSGLKDIPGLSFFPDSVACDGNNWLFQIRCKNPAGLMRYLQERDIESSRIWVPLSDLKLNSGMNRFIPAGNSRKLYDSVLSLPTSAGLEQADLEKVIHAVKMFFS